MVRQIKGNSFWAKPIDLVFPSKTIRVKHIKESSKGNKFKGARLFEDEKGRKIWLPKHVLLPLLNKRVLFMANSTVKVRKEWLEERAGEVTWITKGGTQQENMLLANQVERLDYTEYDGLIKAEQEKRRFGIESYSDHLNNRHD